MDNKQKIIDLLFIDDWDEIIRISQEEKVKRKEKNLKIVEEGILGIKKGFINCFVYKGRNRYSDLKEQFKFFNCQVYDYRDEEWDETKFWIKICKEEYVDYNEEKFIYFDIKKISKKYYVENNEGEKFKFENLSELKANLRDKRIDSIFKD